MTAATAVFRHRQLDLAGSSIHVIEVGDPLAARVLFLHGWPEDWSAWTSVMTLAAGQVRAVASICPASAGPPAMPPTVPNGSWPTRSPRTRAPSPRPPAPDRQLLLGCRHPDDRHGEGAGPVEILSPEHVPQEMSQAKRPVYNQTVSERVSPGHGMDSCNTPT